MIDTTNLMASVSLSLRLAKSHIEDAQAAQATSEFFLTAREIAEAKRNLEDAYADALTLYGISKEVR